MPWTQDDWTAWIDRSRTPPSADEQAHVVRAILGRLPGARHRTLALIGADREPDRPLLASRFGGLVELARPGELRRVRAARSIDAALVEMRHASRDELDALLARLLPRLSEGAPAIVRLAAAPRSSRPTPLVPPRADGSRRPAAWHEIEVQYRFRRAGYQGVRARRFGAVGGEVILAIGVRRGWN